jgi:hypothetical protein
VNSIVSIDVCIIIMFKGGFIKSVCLCVSEDANEMCGRIVIFAHSI